MLEAGINNQLLFVVEMQKQKSSFYVKTNMQDIAKFVDLHLKQKMDIIIVSDLHGPINGKTIQ